MSEAIYYIGVPDESLKKNFHTSGQKSANIKTFRIRGGGLGENSTGNSETLLRNTASSML